MIIFERLSSSNFNLKIPRRVHQYKKLILQLRLSRQSPTAVLYLSNLYYFWPCSLARAALLSNSFRPTPFNSFQSVVNPPGLSPVCCKMPKGKSGKSSKSSYVTINEFLHAVISKESEEEMRKYLEDANESTVDGSLCNTSWEFVEGVPYWHASRQSGLTPVSDFYHGIRQRQ